MTRSAPSDKPAAAAVRASGAAPSRRESAAPAREGPGFWVFGYGSLMWRPGFDYLERRLARLDGYRRAFALRSVRYRGTPERPGLVLGLDWAPGAACIGMAFRVCPTQDGTVRDYLAGRELVTRSYFEVRHRVALMPEGEDEAGPDDRGEARVEAIAYVLDRTHPQYCGGLDPETQAEIIAVAVGPAGPNAEYLHNTAAHLAELGIRDPDLERLDAAVRARREA
ncbi:MAG: gamma-glutamylcyclotransferase [Paracoccaceae bacterium]